MKKELKDEINQWDNNPLVKKEAIKNPNRSRAAGYLISWDFLILTGIINNRCRAQDKETTLSVHK